MVTCYTRLAATIVPILLVAAACLHAQRLTVSTIDSSEFPTMRARIYAVDASGKLISGLTTSDITVTENGVPRPVASINCPTPPRPEAISSVLTIDVSGSMQSPGTAAGTANIELARAAARAWIDALPASSECAISSFDDAGLINQDFTTDHARLAEATMALKPSGGTNYNAGLISSPAGGITIALGGRNRRVVVFLTDGRGDGNEDAIVTAAAKGNVTVFCVTLGMPAPPELKRIAQRTGGECYENVTSVDEARGIYQAILYRSLGGEPCTIEWASEPSCSIDRTATIAVPARSIATSVSYTAPRESIPQLTLSPAALAFGVVAPGSSKELQITIAAANKPIRVDRIELVGRPGNFTLSGGDGAFTLAAGQRRTLTVRYAARDTNYAFARWAIRGDACFGGSIAASAGSGATASPTIRLVVPNGGERFQAGEITSVTWDGVLPTDTVRLDYSTNNGATWRSVADRAVGGTYRWKVPATPSERCLARVGQLDMQTANKKTAITLSGHTDYVMSTNFSPDGSRAVTASWDGTARIWDARTGRALRTLTISTPRNGGYATRVFYAEFSPDGSRVLTAADGGDVGVWDAESGRRLFSINGKPFNKPDVEGARMDGDVTPDRIFSDDGSRILVRSDRDATLWDARTGRKIAALKGHGGWVESATFSPDGRRVITASQDSTARIWDAANGRELRRFAEHHDRVAGATFSPDARYAATSGSDDTVRVWDVGSGEQIHAFGIKERKGGSYLRAAFSPDGTQLLVWAGVDIAPRLYDLASGKMVRELLEDPDGGRTSVGFMLFSPDGGRVASRAATVDLFDLNTGAKMNEFTWDMQMSYLAFSPDGSRLAASAQKEVKLWSVEAATKQSDVSDAVWAIVDSRPASVDVDFGKHIVRTKNDSVVVGYISNRGTAPLRVDAITIGGKNAKEFTLVSGIPPFEVPPGSARNVEFRFAPAGVGERTATASIDAGGRVLQQSLRGEGAWETLRLETQAVDFGDVGVGEHRDSTVRTILKNQGRTPITVAGITIGGPDSTQFSVTDGTAGFTLAAGAERAITVRFAPGRGGRTSTRLAFARAGGDPLVAELYGRGIGDDAEPAGPDVVYTDPTTFRTIAAPNAIVPARGTIVGGVYDLAGLMAGYVVFDDVMILGGGGVPLPDDWGGVKGSMYGAYSLGVKARLLKGERLQAAVGYQWARSIYDQEQTPDTLESGIVAHTPYAAVSYGDDDSRASITAGYAFKHHTTIDAGEFNRNALIMSIGGDYRFANRWKVAGELLAMQTLGYAPIAFTARFFGETYAVDAGFAYLGLATGDGDVPSLKFAPVISLVKVW